MAHVDYVAKQLEYETNILKTFRQATADQIVDGKRWYPQAIETIRTIANTNGYLTDSRLPSAVCAVLSPRITWKSNIEGLARMLKASANFQSVCPTVAGVRRNVEKAWEMLRTGDTSTVSGPKVTAFHANLSGDFSRVTIDVWAARAAGVSESEMNHLDRKRYVTLESAYRYIAKELSFQPAELQAIVWIVARGHGEGTQQGTNQARWTGNPDADDLTYSEDTAVPF